MLLFSCYFLVVIGLFICYFLCKYVKQLKEEEEEEETFSSLKSIWYQSWGFESYSYYADNGNDRSYENTHLIGVLLEKNPTNFFAQ